MKSGIKGGFETRLSKCSEELIDSVAQIYFKHNSFSLNKNFQQRTFIKKISELPRVTSFPSLRAFLQILIVVVVVVVVHVAVDDVEDVASLKSDDIRIRGVDAFNVSTK